MTVAIDVTEMPRTLTSGDMEPARAKLSAPSREAAVPASLG